MADLEIEGSFEEQWGIVKSAVKQHNTAINGNGQPGLLDFMSGIKAQQRLIIGLLAFISLLLTAAGVAVTIRSAQKGSLAIPHLSKSAEPLSARSRPQDAGAHFTGR